MRECAQKLGDPAAKIDGQAQDRAQLNNDCVHLPVSVTQIDVKQGFGMRRCAVELTGKNSVKPSIMPRTAERR